MSQRNKSYTGGFTLVEMIVVIPMVIAILGVVIALMTTLINNVASSNGSSQMLYDAQDALTKIEQDTFYSNGFLSSFTPPSPQDINNSGTTAFTSANGNSTSIILNEFATSANPQDTSRQLVFYATPNLCTANYKANDPFYIKVIYFVKNNVLYRRVIVPTNNQNSTPDANTTCSAPWQRNSCASGVVNTACKAIDSALVSGVSSISLTYYDKTDPTTNLTADEANSIKVTLNLSSVISGNPTTLTLSISASQANAGS